MPDPKLRPPFGQTFAVRGVTRNNGVAEGDSFDINLTGTFWIKSRVSSFVYNKTEYQAWMLAIARVDPGNQELYAAAKAANLYVFLAEPANPQRVADTGQIRSPFRKVDLAAPARATLEANLNHLMTTSVHEAMLKQQGIAFPELVTRLVHGEAKLNLEVQQVDFGAPLGVRQHVLGTWTMGGETVFSLQGWKRPNTGQIESLEAIDGCAKDKAPVIAAIADWAEEAREDFTIENVFSGGRFVRHSAAYESSSIYLERMTPRGRHFERILYGA
jgi:hypothetical protein